MQATSTPPNQAEDVHQHDKVSTPTNEEQGAYQYDKEATTQLRALITKAETPLKECLDLVRYQNANPNV
jgi:hypothetical protein